MTAIVWPWIIFTVSVLGMLALDLGVFHRDAHVVTKKEAALWSLVWILLALIFNAGIYYVSGPVRALEFLTGYLIEYSLSVDNIFVFMVIFFIVYTSNVFAILGLRALYFLLAGVMGLFYYLRYGLGSVLGFVGMKMMLADVYKISIGVSLGVIAALLTLSILASLLFPRKSSEAELGVTTSLEELRSTATPKDLH